MGSHNFVPFEFRSVGFLIARLPLYRLVCGITMKVIKGSVVSKNRPLNAAVMFLEVFA